MFKIIDLYIIRKFLVTFFVAIFLIVIIVIAFDISEKIDDFIERQAPLREIFLVYYLNFIPYFVNLFSPLFTFISVVFFTSRMASNTEIVAILTGGINFKRMLVPFILVSIFLGLFSFWLTNFLIPPANKKRLDFEERYVKTIKKTHGRNIHLQIAPDLFVFVESFSLETNRGYRFAIERIDFTKGLLEKLSADVIIWDSINQLWKLQNCHIRKITSWGENLQKYSSIDTALNFYPHDFRSDTYMIELMNFSELRSFIKRQKLKGSETVVYYEVEQYRRTAFPFATIILTLIGVAVSSRKTKGGIGIHLGIGITLSFTYILLMQISTTFSTQGNLPPLVGVWLPNIIFLFIAIYLLVKLPK